MRSKIQRQKNTNYKRDSVVENKLSSARAATLTQKPFKMWGLRLLSHVIKKFTTVNFILVMKR